MNKAVITLIGLVFFSCSSKEASHERVTADQSKEVVNFDWLNGKWKRLHEADGRQTFENWKKENDSHYLGHGFTMEGADTIWQEKMELLKKDTHWLLQVNTPGNDDLVQFDLSENESTSFTVENQSHDFPKVIKYWQEGENMHALVSGDSMEITFEFERINE